MMVERKNCPLCKKEVVSDAATSGFCVLCGMALVEEQELFCSERCEKKYSLIYEEGKVLRKPSENCVQTRESEQGSMMIKICTMVDSCYCNDPVCCTAEKKS